MISYDNSQANSNHTGNAFRQTYFATCACSMSPWAKVSSWLGGNRGGGLGGGFGGGGPGARPDPLVYIYLYILDLHRRLTAPVKLYKARFEAVM